ncbi:MAG: DMT family transporter [Pseudomonadota bacterium]
MPPTPPPAAGPSSAARGTLLFLATILLFGGLDTLGKHLTQDYHVVQISWGRYVFNVAFVLMLMPHHGFVRPFASARPWLQLVRATLLTVTTVLFFTAVSYLPLAETTAIGFVAPLVITALAAVVLKERVGPRRWAAVVAGFLGVLAIVRPGAGIVHWAASIAVAMAVCNAGYHLATRMLAGVDTTATTFYYTSVVGAVLLSLAVPFFWTPLDALGWLQLASLGVLAGLAHYLLILAYTHATASTLAPYSYLQLVWVTVLGYVVFGDFPDAWTMVGAAIVTASGIYVFVREARLRRQGRL